MGDKNTEESIYGVKASYLESYLGNEEARKIIPIWKKCQTRHNMNFNIAAFLFDVIWYFHKGVYKAGVIFLAVMLIVPNVLGAVAGVISMENTIKYYNENVIVHIVNGVTVAPDQMGAVSLVNSFYITFIITSLIIKLISALFFDYLYFKKVKYCIFYELAGMKDMNDDESVSDCLSRAGKHRETKEKGIRTGIITGYIIIYLLRFIF
ncbi:MAG: hypothetical protein IJZ72_06815 [Oscillospiraceae bacterium]|nr:hypothetical protein [Oscillospiraceae bacterium]